MHVILAIDDDPSTLRIIESQLSGHHYRVFTELSALKGLELSRTMNPDLILLDINMPEMDGFHVLDALRKDEVTSHVPVIMVTAVSEKKFVMEAMRQGVMDYIVKPYEAEKLLSKIKTALRFRDMMREEIASDSSDKIYVSLDKDAVLITFKTELIEKKFLAESRKVFTHFFFKQLKKRPCIIDLRSLMNFTEKDARILEIIIELFGVIPLNIVAGRHYGVIVAHVDVPETVSLFISFGDMELALNQKLV